MNIDNENNENNENTEQIKNAIEKMEKNHHIEILKILKKTNSIRLNENKSGVFVNITLLPKHTMEEIIKYVEFIQEQEKTIARQYTVA